MGKTMKTKAIELLDGCGEDMLPFDTLAVLISEKIGGDLRTQRSYIGFMEDMGFIDQDKKDPSIFNIRRDKYVQKE